MKPDYKSILFRLADKIKRNGDYYRQIAADIRTNALLNPHSADDIALRAKAASLERCATDMDYTFERAIERLTAVDIDEIHALST
jgi:hypothetical protein